MGLLDIIVPPTNWRLENPSPPKSQKNIPAVPYINICKESTTSRHEVMLFCLGKNNVGLKKSYHNLPMILPGVLAPIILVTLASGCVCRGGTWGSLPGGGSCQGILWRTQLLPSREVTYPTFAKRKLIIKTAFSGNTLFNSQGVYIEYWSGVNLENIGSNSSLFLDESIPAGLQHLEIL